MAARPMLMSTQAARLLQTVILPRSWDGSLRWFLATHGV